MKCGGGGRPAFQDLCCQSVGGSREHTSHNADTFVAMYADAASQDHVHDKHQGRNAEIALRDPDHATALRCRDDRNIRNLERTLALMNT